MNEMKKTIFLDIDGCILYHKGNLSNQMLLKPELLSNVIEKLNEWEAEGHKIILITGRKESMRNLTENQLEKLGIFYDQLIMGINRGERILINDFKSNSNCAMATAINVERNKGLADIEI
jgi:histidinol phosphatase-like enzyme